jgi:hypothetical protein
MNMWNAILIASLISLPGQTNEEAVDPQDYTSCAQTSLFLVCKLHDLPVEWSDVKQRFGPAAADGTHSFADIAKVAEAYGFFPVGLNTDRGGLKTLPMPAIIQLHDSRDPKSAPHFVVLMQLAADGAFLLDAPHQTYFVTWPILDKTWTGRILVLARDPQTADRVRASGGAFSVRTVLPWSALFLCAAVIVVISRRFFVKLGDVAAHFARSRPFLRLLVGMGFLLALMVLVRYSGALPFFARPPKLVVETPVVELGDIDVGSRVIHVPLRNEGGRPLIISQAQTTCSCTVAKLPAPIPAYRSADLEIRINVSPGDRRAIITLQSNDQAGDRHIALSWHGRSNPYLEPAWVSASEVPMGRPYERIVRVMKQASRSSSSMQLANFECDKAGVALHVLPQTATPTPRIIGSDKAAHGEMLLALTVGSPMSPGAFQATCSLILSEGEATWRLPLQVQVDFVGALVPDPPSVVFSAADPNSLVGQSAKVELRAAKNGSRLRADGLPAFLAHEINYTESQLAVLTLRVASAPTNKLGRYTFWVASEDQPETRTPINVNVYTADK